MKKFLDNKVTVEESVERNEKLRPPAITICSTNGWVRDTKISEMNGYFKLFCGKESTSDAFLACVKRSTIGFNDLVISATHGHKGRDLPYFKFWTWDISFPVQ